MRSEKESSDFRKDFLRRTLIFMRDWSWTEEDDCRVRTDVSSWCDETQTCVENARARTSFDLGWLNFLVVSLLRNPKDNGDASGLIR